MMPNSDPHDSFVLPVPLTYDKFLLLFSHIHVLMLEFINLTRHHLKLLCIASTTMCDVVMTKLHEILNAHSL